MRGLHTAAVLLEISTFVGGYCAVAFWRHWARHSRAGTSNCEVGSLSGEAGIWETVGGHCAAWHVADGCACRCSYQKEWVSGGDHNRGE